MNRILLLPLMVLFGLLVRALLYPVTKLDVLVLILFCRPNIEEWFEPAPTVSFCPQIKLYCDPVLVAAPPTAFAF
ncbi:hypothetical protein D3C72_1987070 [compost metagenome]